MSEKSDYIAAWIKKGKTKPQAEYYWKQKMGNTPDAAAPESLGGSFGGQIGKAHDPNYPEFGITDAVPDRNRRAGVSTHQVIDEATDKGISVFKRSGVPVVRKMGDRRRWKEVSNE